MDPPELTITPEDADQELQLRRLRYQEAFEFAPDCQLITDGDGVILEANHAAAALVGHRREFLIGKPLVLFSTSGAWVRFHECLTHLSRGNATDTFETQMVSRGDESRKTHIIARAGGRSNPLLPVTIHWLVRDVTEWHKANEMRSDLQRRLASAREDEQRRVARDLHDTVSQTLTALTLGLRAIRDSGDLPERSLRKLNHVQHLTDDLAKQVHEVAVRLRPIALDDLGLEAAIRQLVGDWSHRVGIAADFQSAGLADKRFPPEVEAALYRVVQEALTNVAKHAGARRVAVVIGRNDGHAVAVIEDDGIGFEMDTLSQTPMPGRTPSERGRLGLAGMRERLSLVGGRLEIETSPGRGTTIIARVPLSERKAPVSTPVPSS